MSESIEYYEFWQWFDNEVGETFYEDGRGCAELAWDFKQATIDQLTSDKKLLQERIDRLEKVKTMAALLIDEYDTHYVTAYKIGRIKSYTDMYEASLDQLKSEV